MRKGKSEWLLQITTLGGKEARVTFWPGEPTAADLVELRGFVDVAIENARRFEAAPPATPGAEGEGNGPR